MKIIKEIQKRIFPTIIALTALSVSASAAFYSVTGLSKLFAGASLQVMVMAGSLEVAKLVIASLLYQYWSQLNKVLRTYLSVATIVLVLITSAGIYGFLSAAYQETATKSGIVDKEVELLELKKNRYVESRDYLLSEKTQLDEAIKSLRDGLANNVIQYKDKETGQIITTTSSSNRRAFQKELESAVTQRESVSQKIEVATDSINSIEVRSLNVTSNSELASELGPLKYLSELTDAPMNKIINILLLVIIFVFDPLAISLVVAANFAFEKLVKKEDEKDETIVGKEPDSEQETLVDEEEANEDNLYDEEFYNWEKKSVEDLHLKDIEEDLEPDFIFSKEEVYPFGDDHFKDLDATLMDGLEEEEWDEDHALDQVMNDMVSDMDMEELNEDLFGEDEEEIEESEEWDELHSLDQVLNTMVDDIEEYDEVVKHPEVKLEELKDIEVKEEEVIETETTTIFEEEDEDLGDDTTYDEELKEVEPPKRLSTKSPYLRVGSRIIPRNER